MRIGTNADDVRRRNLSVVLTLAHRRQALSRADLTRRTGLSRSTVKALVEELVEAGLVEEVEAESQSQVGRPSRIVQPQSRTLAVAVNPEVDAVTVGLVALGGRVVEMTRRTTTGIPSAKKAVEIAADIIADMRTKLPAGQHIYAIGVAVPGLVHAANKAVQLAPNLDWHDESLGEMLSAATDLPVFAANDANAGAIAEHIFGRHVDADHMIYVNGGAGGIGAGFVVAGELLEGAAGYAGELGHTFVGGGGSCHCGRVGCLETAVSQAQISAATPDRMAKVVERQAQYLGIALGNAINMLNPRLIVLGGFLRQFPELAPRTLLASVAGHSLRGPNDLVRIVPASLGAETLMIGAAEMAFAQLLSDPVGNDQRVDRDGAAGA